MNKLFLRTLIVFGLFFCLGLITSCIGFNQGGSNETGGNKNNENENKHQHVECSHCGLCMDSNCDGDSSAKCICNEIGCECIVRNLLNRIGFDGQGMDFVIKVFPVNKFDPFLNDYTGNKQALKQAHQKCVEDAYNIKIIYSDWGYETPWGLERIEFIKKSFYDGSLQNNNVYAINIDSQWIPSLVKANCLAELYNTKLETGFFADYNYKQNKLINESLKVRDKIYGYNIGNAYPDSFIYYNADKVNSIGVDDPAELWLKGEWTWSKFDEWVREAQTKLGEGEYALDLGYADFIIGAASAQGSQIVDSNRGTLNLTTNAVISIAEKMKVYYNEGYWDKSHGIQDVSQNFKRGKTLLHSGKIWYLQESTHFAKTDEGEIPFKIGVVPYPINDNSVVNIKTTPYSYNDIFGNTVEVCDPIIGRNGEVLKTNAGKTIYGIDLSESNYLVPFSGCTNYAILNNISEDKNGITNSIAFSILYDLQSGMLKDPADKGLTPDDAYRIYLYKEFDYLIDVEVIMSVQDASLVYYEAMETLSVTCGKGSHPDWNDFLGLMAKLMESEESAATKLEGIQRFYEVELREYR
jgi:hypothetical protein